MTFPRNLFAKALSLCTAGFFLVAQAAAGDPINWTPPSQEGFYKQVLINGGPGVTGPSTSLFEDIGLSYETLSARNCPGDVDGFEKAVVGSEIDSNGMLLYPDGAPRFRMMTTGGAEDDSWDETCSVMTPVGNYYGGAETNYHSLSAYNPYLPGSNGAAQIRTFFDNGGSFTGFCAGAFLADSDRLNLYGGRMIQEEGQITRTMGMSSNSPLSAYTNVTSAPVANIGGGYLNWSDIPDGTEILASAGPRTGIWAYKGDDMSGRMVITGHHPEIGSNENAHQFAKAMFAYAIDGNGDAAVYKGTLATGQPRLMNKRTQQRDPDYTRIGDKQYHHFIVNVPSNHSGRLTLDVTQLIAENGGDLFQFNLYARKGTAAAFDSTTDIQTTFNSETGSLCIPLSGGAQTWRVSVECADTVQVRSGRDWPFYSGKTQVLNGLAYSISADWTTNQSESLALTALPSNSYRQGEVVYLNWNWQGRADAFVSIYLRLPNGQEQWLADTDADTQHFAWQTAEDQQLGDYQFAVTVTGRCDGDLIAESDVFAVTPAAPDEVPFTDDYLRLYMVQRYDFNGDGFFDIEEAAQVTGTVTIQYAIRGVGEPPTGLIRDISGIEYLTNITGLVIHEQPITTLAPLRNSHLGLSPGHTLDVRFNLLAGDSTTFCVLTKRNFTNYQYKDQYNTGSSDCGFKPRF